MLVDAVVAIAFTVGAARAAPVKAQDTSLSGRGQLVRVPARLEMDPGTRVGVRIQRLLFADRLRGRHRRRHGPTVDFGASDAPLSPDQISTACKGCVQVPWALSATSIPYNLPGLTVSSG